MLSQQNCLLKEKKIRNSVENNIIIFTNRCLSDKTFSLILLTSVTRDCYGDEKRQLLYVFIFLNRRGLSQQCAPRLSL